MTTGKQLDAVALLEGGAILVVIERPDDYEDVHADLMFDDFCEGGGRGFSAHVAPDLAREVIALRQQLADEKARHETAELVSTVLCIDPDDYVKLNNENAALRARVEVLEGALKRIGRVETKSNGQKSLSGSIAHAALTQGSETGNG